MQEQKDSFKPKDFWEKRLSREYNLAGVGYESLGKGWNHWMYKVRKDIFYRYLDQLNLDPSSARILDIGSGTGFYINLLQERGYKNVTGLDITETAVNNLSQRFSGYQFIRADISDQEPIPLEEGSFDLITCFDVLFHIVDDQRFEVAIGRISKLLKPGGNFLFSDNFVRKEERRQHHVSRSRSAIVKTLEAKGIEPGPLAPMFVLLNEPSDTRNPFLKMHWTTIVLLLRYIKPLSYPLGAIFYPLELLLIRTVGSGPSTKIMLSTRKHS